ncbi:MAG: SAM-dependent chlorinase/fluorinase [Chloroflexota bacterium]|nr:SAM-dependent chlorinase/fluorinase [Chloroflexota bacterium]
MNPPIVLLTDFGSHDPFVGIMKGVITEINPATPLIDLSHEIPPGDIQRTAITLWQSAPYFPKGSIFLTVVDPGVGTQRHAIILESGPFKFVGPDNGAFTFISDDDTKAWKLSNPAFALSNPGMTFHGRDIFAPAAAHASRGISSPELGEPIPNLVRIAEPQLKSTPDGILHGEILHADHFGNTLTSLGQFLKLENGNWQLQPWVGHTPSLEINLNETHLQLPNGDYLPWAKTFGEIPAGQCAAIIGSNGLIEIAANGQSAAKLLGCTGGEALRLFMDSKHPVWF